MEGGDAGCLPRGLAHIEQQPARLVAAAGQPETDHADPVVGADEEQGRLDGHEPLDVTRHHYCLLEARGDVRVESTCLFVRGAGLLEEATIATGVDEPREELRVVAVTVGLAQ